MNSIRSLERRLRKLFPMATIAVDAPRNPKGRWFLDVNLNGRNVSIEWRYGQGYGITSKRFAGYGEGPDEVFSDLNSAAKRVIALLGASAPASEPKGTA